MFVFIVKSGSMVTILEVALKDIASQMNLSAFTQQRYF